jgi:hypothetical protein
MIDFREIKVDNKTRAKIDKADNGGAAVGARVQSLEDVRATRPVQPAVRAGS